MIKRRTNRGCVLLAFALLVVSGVTIGDEGVAASRPVGNLPVRAAARPVNRYAAAGAARRAAGIETWMFVHPTWINWHPAKYTSPFARELVDGYLLVMLDRPGSLPTNGTQAARHIARAGMRFIPGMRLGPDKEYREWTDPSTWKKDLDFYKRMSKEFQLGAQAPLVVEMEPYWEGKRYPRGEDVYAMAQAMGEWQEIAKKTPLWVLPGGVHYWNSWLMASWRAPHGTVYVLDEGTYSRAGGDEARLEKMMRERSAFMRSLGMTYVPGFYLRHAMDPGLYATLKKCGIQRCWFYAQAVPDEYNKFGTAAWKHSR